MGRRRRGRIENNLHQAGTVAEIAENEAAMVSSSVDPTGQGYLLSCVHRA
jgi:hypothetical protein